jgi:hypothetical protein
MRGTLAIAGYIAKYVGKSLLEAFNRKKYLHSRGVKVSPAVTKWLQAETLWDALVEAATARGFTNQLDKVRLFNGSAFIRVHVSELDPPPF